MNDDEMRTADDHAQTKTEERVVKSAFIRFHFRIYVLFFLV